MPDLSLIDYVILLSVGVAAGFVDSIAGGGGLIALPAILWAGVPPVEALATNKLQGTMGTMTASMNYCRHGLIDLKTLWFAVVMTFVGSVTGVIVVLWLPSDWLKTLVPILLIAMALYFFFSPQVKGIKIPKQHISVTVFSFIAGFGLGFYDGFFGPGAGSFFTLAFILLLGYALPQAIGGTKLLNFTSNIAALLAFIISGHVLWMIGLIMGLGQMVGSYLGSHMAIRHGAQLIRPLLVIVSIAMSLKLLFD